MSQADVEEKEKGQVVKEIVEKGRFHKHLVVLLNLLVQKTYVTLLLSEVLGEFERIYNELSGINNNVINAVGVGLVKNYT